MSTQDQDKAYRLYEEGRAALERQDLPLAVQKFKESMQFSPHFKTYELLGECLLKKGELKEATLYLSAAAGLGNKAFRARYLLAKALLSLGGRESDAVEKLDEAIAINPDFKAAKELLEQFRK